MQKLKDGIWRRDEGIKIRLRLVYVSFTSFLRKSGYRGQEDSAIDNA